MEHDMKWTRRDVLAMSTQVIIVTSFVVLGILGLVKAFVLLAGFGLDDPLPLPILLLFFFTMSVCEIVCVTVGMLVWVVGMRPFLRREEMERSLNHRIRWTWLLCWNAKLLDRAYRVV